MSTIRPAAFTGLLFGFLSLTASAADWPSHRGPNLDGSAAASGLLDSHFTLELVWKHELGPAYSAISVAGGKVVTLFSDGEKDVAIAFDAQNGEELWRFPFAETYRGHDGSTDGPVGAPTLDQERVYLVGPFGDFAALSLADGKPLWTRHLPKDFSSPKPVYGFSATPVKLGESLLLQVGGDAPQSVIAFDPSNGKVQWSVGDDRFNHPSPVFAKLNGEKLWVSVGAFQIAAIRPQTGELVAGHRHSEKSAFDPTYPQALSLGDDRILLTFSNEAVLYRLTVDALEELWRSTHLKGSTAIPVFHDGYVYGFNGRFLSCVDAETGELMWKSRRPGGRGLILVDDHLFVLGSNGWLTAIKATPEEYREVTGIQVSDQAGYTAPSFADGHLYVRNLTDIAAVRVVPGSAPSDRTATDTPAEETETTAFSAWVDRVHKASDSEAKAKLIDAFMAEHKEFPVIEDERWVHFIYRGPGQEVFVLGQMQKDRDVAEPMQRIPGTRFFHRTYPLEATGRWHYQLQADFENPAPDPLNSRLALGEAQPHSELVMPQFQDPKHIQEPAEDLPRGRLEAFELESKAYGRSIEVQVYLPDGYDSSAQTNAEATGYPVLVIPNGDLWLEAGAQNSLDHLLARKDPDHGIQPAVVVFVPLDGWVGGQWGGRAVQLLGEELPMVLEEKYQTDRSAGSWSLWTVQEKATIGLDILRAYPRFGRAAFQSPRTYRGELKPLPTDRGLRFFISWSRYESKSAETGFDEAQAARDLRDGLKAQGFEVQGGEFIPGPGYRSWRLQTRQILEFLLPAEGAGQNKAGQNK